MNPYPLYVKSGDTVALICQNAKRSNITWQQSTPNTNEFSDVFAGQQGFTIQTCRTDPSGFSKSTLSRFNMSLSTRGSYRCMDKSSSYTIKVTVLYSKLILFKCLSAVLQTFGLLKIIFLSYLLTASSANNIASI